MEPDQVVDRRAHPRLTVLDPGRSELIFAFPDPAGPASSVPLRDICYGGISFQLTESVLGIESGWTSKAALRFGTRMIHGSMLVVHVSPDPHPGGICGAIFFPSGSQDRSVLREVMAELDVD